MPKGKRRKRDYEREIEEAAKRMRKYPEYLEAAMYSEDWQDFLLNVVGINPDSMDSKAGKEFWENVRDKIPEYDVGYTTRYLEEQNVEVVTGVFRDEHGKFTSEVTEKPVYTFRDLESGQFRSPKSFY